MIERFLTFKDLSIDSSEYFRQMGFGESRPDETTCSLTKHLEKEIESFLRPAFSFFVTDGSLELNNYTLSAGGREMRIGKTIALQLRKSQRFSFFTATAGKEFEEFQHRIAEEGDILKIFVADSIGSVIAEAVADRMELELENLISSYSLRHTNRFSPGYCGWDVSSQHDLFSLFPVEKPCGITLSESALMNPIKSVSGVIGIGKDVRKLDYSCGICENKNCFRRMKNPHLSTTSQLLNSTT